MSLEVGCCPGSLLLPWKSAAALEVWQCSWKSAAAQEVRQCPWTSAAALEVCNVHGSLLLPWKSANVPRAAAALEVH